MPECDGLRAVRGRRTTPRPRHHGKRPPTQQDHRVTAVHDPCRSFHSVRRRPIGIDTDARSTSRLLSSARSDDPRSRRPGRARSQRRACRHPIARAHPATACFLVKQGFHLGSTADARPAHHSEPPTIPNRAGFTTLVCARVEQPARPDRIRNMSSPRSRRPDCRERENILIGRHLIGGCHSPGTTPKRGPRVEVPFLGMVSGGVLLSHTVAGAVPLALKGLASGFGMGPGVSPSLWPP